MENNDNARARISISGRLFPIFSYVIAAIGGGISALFLRNVMTAMKYAEASGIAAVSAGMSEANVPVIVGLCLATILGFVGIVIAICRLFMKTAKASPPGWFFIIPAILGFLPAVFLWLAESMILDVVFQRGDSSGGGIAAVASTISYLIIAAMASAVVIPWVLLVAAVVPFSSKNNKKFGSLIILLAFEAALLAALVMFYMRNYGLNEIFERFGAIIVSPTFV